MKMTKTIREFITTTVTEKYAHYCDAEQAAYDEYVTRLKETLAKLTREANEQLRALVPEIGEYNNQRYNVPHICSDATTYGSPLYQALEQKKKKREAAIKKNIDNVILNIELGANRQELMEMLDNIVVD